MRWGGGTGSRRGWRAAMATVMVVAGATATPTLGGATPGSGAPAAGRTAAHGQFRLVRRADGDLTIERAGAAPRASAAAVTPAGAWEQDAVVHATADPNEGDQWGLSAAGFAA